MTLLVLEVDFIEILGICDNLLLHQLEAKLKDTLDFSKFPQANLLIFSLPSFQYSEVSLVTLFSSSALAVFFIHLFLHVLE